METCLLSWVVMSESAGGETPGMAEIGGCAIQGLDGCTAAIVRSVTNGIG